MNSGLPVRNITKRSDEDVRLFFDKYLTKSINFNDNDLNSVVGFFENKGFDKSSAISVSIVMIQQAKLDNIKVFKLLDTLKGYQDIQLSAVVAEVLNYNRKRTSAIGFKKENTDNQDDRDVSVSQEKILEEELADNSDLIGRIKYNVNKQGWFSDLKITLQICLESE